MRPTFSTDFSSASFFIIPLKKSRLTALAAERSWLSAVLIEAARIAQRKIPAINAGYILSIVSLKTVSAAAPERSFGIRYAVPSVPIIKVPMYEIIIQTVPILRAFVSSSSERIPIKRTIM